jgi:hypothetical protein
MKKWVEYQFKNQIKEWDWDYAQQLGASNFGYETNFVMVITGNKLKRES